MDWNVMFSYSIRKYWMLWFFYLRRMCPSTPWLFEEMQISSWKDIFFKTIEETIHFWILMIGWWSLGRGSERLYKPLYRTVSIFHWSKNSPQDFTFERVSRFRWGSVKQERAPMLFWWVAAIRRNQRTSLQLFDTLLWGGLFFLPT